MINSNLAFQQQKKIPVRIVCVFCEIVMLPTLPASIWEKIALFGAVKDYHAVVRAIPSLALFKGVSYRAQQHFTRRATSKYGITTWRLCGLLHRVDGPARIGLFGDMEWYIHGQAHRVDGPARIYRDGGEEWWVNGRLHRVDGPAKTFPDGRKEWHFNNQLHRVDGPALIYPHGVEEWLLNNRYHRIGGPARTFPDGREDEWWVDGKKIPPPPGQKRRRCA